MTIAHEVSKPPGSDVRYAWCPQPGGPVAQKSWNFAASRLRFFKENAADRSLSARLPGTVSIAGGSLENGHQAENGD